MCLTVVKEFEKPVKVMTGWKCLSSTSKKGVYSTPFRGTRLRKYQKYLKAAGDKVIESGEYHGGFIHCYRTREDARRNNEYHYRIVKVKCYNVQAFGARGDLVCDKIKFLWDNKS